MFDRRGSLIVVRHGHGRLFTLLLMVVLTWPGSKSRAADRAFDHVQAALQSEMELDAEKRARLVDVALRADPKSPDAHWARGEVLTRGRWLSLEDSAEEMLAAPELVKYWERRAESDNTVAEHVRLAEYCRSNRLLGQERAHWAAVTALDPNHREARRKLGQVNVDGVWVDRRLVEQQKKKELATSAYLQKHGHRLMSLSIALNGKSKSREDVLSELGEYRNPMVIPGLEYFFSSTGESGGLCSVETMASLTDPEASVSLARHALEFPEESVRTRATNYLKERDEASFVPALLGALQTPVTRVDGFAINYDNQLVWRQQFFTETQDAKRIATLDRVFQIQARVPASFNPNWALGAIARAGNEVESVNTAIDQKNEKIMQLLTDTTKERSSRDITVKKSPEDWWNWWNARIESYPSDEKPVDYRYQVSVVEVPPPPPPPMPRKECLAAGTPIWTETGRVDIELLKVGDLVLSQNQKTGELKFAPVMATSTRPPERLLQIKIQNETVRSTGGHPFWVTGRGWIRARSLEPGMGLHTARGFALIESITEEKDPAEAFNLIVDDNHSYFVGKNLLLSHDNTPCEPIANRVPGLR